MNNLDLTEEEVETLIVSLNSFVDFVTSNQEQLDEQDLRVMEHHVEVLDSAIFKLKQIEFRRQ